MIFMWDKVKKSIIEISKRGAMHITLGSFATKFVGMLGSIFVVRILTKNDYGLVGYIENIYGYFFVFAGLGMSNAMLRYIVKAEPKKKLTYYKYICSRSAIINIFIICCVFVLNAFIEYPSDFEMTSYLLPVLAIMIPFQDLLNDGLFALRSSFKTKEYALWSFLVSVTLVLGRVIGGYIRGASGVIWSRVLINGSFAIFLYMYAKKCFTESEHKLTKEEKNSVFIYSVQYMITNGLWAIFMLNDVQILSMYVADSSIIADYKVALTLPAAITIFSTSIGIFVAPYFTKNEEDKSWVKKNFKITYLATVGVIGAISLFLIVFAWPIICLLYGSSYLNITNLMRVLTVAAFCNSGLRFTSANLLAAMGKIKYNMVVSLVGIILQIVLDIILVQFAGAYGIAISSCIVYLIMAIALLIIFYREYFKE